MLHVIGVLVAEVVIAFATLWIGSVLESGRAQRIAYVVGIAVGLLLLLVIYLVGRRRKKWQVPPTLEAEDEDEHTARIRGNLRQLMRTDGKDARDHARQILSGLVDGMQDEGDETASHVAELVGGSTLEKEQWLHNDFMNKSFQTPTDVLEAFALHHQCYIPMTLWIPKCQKLSTWNLESHPLLGLWQVSDERYLKRLDDLSSTDEDFEYLRRRLWWGEDNPLRTYRR